MGGEHGVDEPENPFEEGDMVVPSDGSGRGPYRVILVKRDSIVVKEMFQEGSIVSDGFMHYRKAD